MSFVEDINSIATSLTGSAEVDSWNLIVTIILAIATIALASLLGIQVFSQRKEVKLAYLPYIIPRQVNDSVQFRFDAIQNIGNGAAKNVVVTITHISSNTSITIRPLGLRSSERFEIPRPRQIIGNVNDEVLMNVSYEDVTDTTHTYSRQFRVSELVS
jgi:hypothetical protein